MAILYFEKQDIFRFIVIKNRRVNYFCKIFVISGCGRKLEIKGIFLIFAAKAVLNGRGIGFIIIAVSIAIAITI